MPAALNGQHSLHPDVCVLGGGPSGYAATFRALDLGLSVVMVEKGRLGGAGIHNGALYSKTLWELARDFSKARTADRGYAASTARADYRAVEQVLQDAVGQKCQQLELQVAMYEQQLGPERFRLLRGTGVLAGPHQVNVRLNTGGTLAVKPGHIVLATGSSPRRLPHLPIDEQFVLTSDGLSNLPAFPKSLVILGAGVIGCEYATMFALFGQTQVRIIDKASRILPFEDPDISEVIEHKLEELGVFIHKNARLERMEVEGDRVRYELCFTDDRCETHYAERALVSVGRVANTANLGLQEAGVGVNAAGNVEVNAFGQTTVPHIWAVGDLTADICLVNVGEMEARMVAERIAGHSTPPMNYENISTIMFLNPEVAAVGMNEQQAQRAGLNYRVARLGYAFVNRAIAMRAMDGFFKLLVTDDDEMRILGMRVVGPQASSAIQAVSLLIAQRAGVRALAECPYPHPSVTEGLQECARMLLGTSIIKPNVFVENLRCWRVHNGQQTVLC